MTCFVLLVMGLGLGFVFSSLRASHCMFCTFKCALLFGLLILSLFSSLVPLIGVFPLFIYLGNIDLSINMKKKLKFFCLHLHGTLNLLCEWVCHHMYKLSPTLHKVLPLLSLSWLPCLPCLTIINPSTPYKPTRVLFFFRILLLQQTQIYLFQNSFWAMWSVVIGSKWHADHGSSCGRQKGGGVATCKYLQDWKVVSGQRHEVTGS